MESVVLHTLWMTTFVTHHMELCTDKVLKGLSAIQAGPRADLTSSFTVY